MDMCSAKIRLSGDMQQVVHRLAHDPVSWPEIGVIKFIHGEDAVFDVEKVAEIDADALGEKRRLMEIYEPGVVNMLFPGARPFMELAMPDGPGPEDQPKVKVKDYPVKTVAVKPSIGVDRRPSPVPKPEPYKDSV